jgi:hypothetical protein
MLNATQTPIGGTKVFLCSLLSKSPVYIPNATQTALGGTKQFLCS